MSRPCPDCGDTAHTAPRRRTPGRETRRIVQSRTDPPVPRSMPFAAGEKSHQWLKMPSVLRTTVCASEGISLQGRVDVSRKARLVGGHERADEFLVLGLPAVRRRRIPETSFRQDAPVRVEAPLQGGGAGLRRAPVQDQSSPLALKACPATRHRARLERRNRPAQPDPACSRRRRSSCRRSLMTAFARASHRRIAGGVARHNRMSIRPKASRHWW